MSSELVVRSEDPKDLNLRTPCLRQAGELNYSELTGG